ncbi:tetratricopeptide repeat protein [Ruegeria sediminis]|uniref:Tetratricopeptide repeat protein n=1 Tax=Ruegeria sediminis TaxID=2583820 RepID=A0ABY2WW87_9RHOB|nr:tetratricopeptide repeat protein [Ruegeria sediminis]TMV07019.1 tetratricopeptide repeat protein [Ruegeria sediminis]
MSQFGFFRGARVASALCVAILLLSACDTAEERAEAHFQAGMALLEEGDVEGALSEFREVFRLNGNHEDARATVARVQRERGNIGAAYGHYLRLVERYPENLEGRRALAEMALELENWDDARRHGAAAAELAPDDIDIKSVNNALAYFDAILDGDANGADAAVRAARELVSVHPDLTTARKVVIDSMIRIQDWQGVLEEVGAAENFAPGRFDLHEIRLRAFKELDRPEEIEAQLKLMQNVFPDNRDLEQMLLQHYVAQDNLDAAERILRAEVAAKAGDVASARALVAFLEQYRGIAAAIAELDRMIAQNGPNLPQFESMRAMLKFRSGDRQAAILEMQALVEDAERSEHTRESEVDLARMLAEVGKHDAARSLVEKVLREDPIQLDALKLSASWLIENGSAGEAIGLLRRALGLEPRDPQLLTLMARAHERNGDRALMGEMLVLSAEVSENAPAESLRYARYLIDEGDMEIAESVLITSLRRNPGNLDLLSMLSEIHLNTQNWEQLEAVLDSLRVLDDPEAERLSAEVSAHMIAARARADDLSAILLELADDPDFGLSADVTFIRTMLARGNTPGAIARLDSRLDQNPDSLPLRIIKAHLLAGEGKYPEAERLYRAILRDHPEAARAWVALYDLQSERGKTTEARSVLLEALKALPENPDLLMLLAKDQESSGDVEQAIAAYEKLYLLDNRSPVVANNLARLLSTHRDDDQSLQQALSVARRLRGIRVPEYQNTYGWIAFRLGNYEEALIYLQPAARARPDQPLFLYHLGRTYAALDRNEDALRAYRAASDLGVSLDVTPTLDDEVQRLKASINGDE